MRLARRNKQDLYYALLDHIGEEYVLDKDGNKVVDYVDDDGTIYYRMTGSKKLYYKDPVKFKANIAFGGSGESQTVEFGVDVSAYDATVIYLRNEFPITETTLIWHETKPKFIGEFLDDKSADYKVLAVKESLNITKVLLGRLTK